MLSGHKLGQMKAADTFDEFVEELIENNPSKDVKWLKAYIHETTGTLYSEMHIHKMRQHVLLAQKRADRVEEREWAWSRGLPDGAI
mgnify:CR=1 FL=1